MPGLLLVAIMVLGLYVLVLGAKLRRVFGPNYPLTVFKEDVQENLWKLRYELRGGAQHDWWEDEDAEEEPYEGFAIVTQSLSEALERMDESETQIQRLERWVEALSSELCVLQEAVGDEAYWQAKERLREEVDHKGNG